MLCKGGREQFSKDRATSFVVEFHVIAVHVRRATLTNRCGIPLYQIVATLSQCSEVTAQPPLYNDFNHRQFLPKVFDASVGDLCTVEVQLPQFEQSLQMDKTGVSHARLLKVESSQTGQSRELRDSRIRDLQPAEIQALQSGEQKGATHQPTS